MAHQPTRRGGGSNGPANHGGNRPSGSRTTQPAAYPGGQQHNPQNNAHYIAVARPRDNHSHLENVTNDPALRTGSNSSYGAPHASPYGGNAGRYSFGNGLSAPQASQTQSVEPNRVQSPGHPSDTHRSYVQQILYQAPHNTNEPYNAVGFIRRDGQVYDNAEVYEEYRPYEQVDRLDENRSDDWTNVKTNVPWWTE